MIWLGIGLFFGLHLLPSMPNVRDQLIGRVGEKRYKGGYALLSFGGLVLIILGYGNIGIHELWAAPDWGSHLAFAVMPVVFVLLAAAELKGHIRTTIKHPMLIGVLLWGGVHLVNNGDRASLYLFGSFVLFSLYAIIFSSRRDQGRKDYTPKARHDVIALVVGTVLFVVVLWGHPFLFGVTPTL